MNKRQWELHFESSRKEKDKLIEERFALEKENRKLKEILEDLRKKLKRFND